MEVSHLAVLHRSAGVRHFYSHPVAIRSRGDTPAVGLGVVGVRSLGHNPVGLGVGI